MFKGHRGYTFIELLVVVTILMILASAVLPLAQVTSQRQREAELRRNLREIRTAIDNGHVFTSAGQSRCEEPANSTSSDHADFHDLWLLPKST